MSDDRLRAGPSAGLAWRECVCGAWYWGSEQTEADKAHTALAASAPDEGPRPTRDDIEAMIENADDDGPSVRNQDRPDEDITLFHGHHPACPYTIEGDWSVCRCGARPTAPALDVERLRDALIAWAVKDEPLLEGETIVAVALPTGTPDEIAALIAREYAALQEQPE